MSAARRSSNSCNSFFMLCIYLAFPLYSFCSHIFHQNCSVLFILFYFQFLTILLWVFTQDLAWEKVVIISILSILVFCLNGCLTKAKEPSLHNYFTCWVRKDKFMPLLLINYKYWKWILSTEMQNLVQELNLNGQDHLLWGKPLPHIHDWPECL